MAVGTVKWFNDAKGYGFISRQDDGKDVFVHYSSITGEGFRTLNQGQTVEYEESNGPEGAVRRQGTQGSLEPRAPSSERAGWRGSRRTWCGVQHHGERFLRGPHLKDEVAFGQGTAPARVLVRRQQLPVLHRTGLDDEPAVHVLEIRLASARRSCRLRRTGSSSTSRACRPRRSRTRETHRFAANSACLSVTDDVGETFCLSRPSSGVTGFSPVGSVALLARQLARCS